MAFVDWGNVFNTDCPEESIGCFKPTWSEVRGSVGLGFSWLTQMGPMSFSLSQPINDAYFDEPEVFSFEIGQSF